jgi:hypothetical protein
VLQYESPAPAKAHIGGTLTVQIPFALKEGYHVNSDKPSEAYLIPLRLTWSKGVLEPEQVVYPQPKMEKYEFSTTPLSVFSGMFQVTAKFKVPASAFTGPAAMNGKLRYQACNNKMCLPPKDIPVSLQLDIVK